MWSPEERVLEPVGAPSRCPVCRATDLTTTSKTIDRSTYWRCLACGEVWNVARRGTGDGFGPRRR
jgi:transposase-like protein